MNDLVGIIRREGEIQRGAGAARRASRRGPSAVQVEGHRQFNPGWHLALDLRNMLLVSECVALAALERTESRGGHTRDDYPAMDPRVAPGEPRLLETTDGSATAGDRAAPTSRSPAIRLDLFHLFDRKRAGEVPHAGRAAAARRPDRLEERRRELRRALPGLARRRDGGELQDFTVEVNEGEVVLDIIHRLQATQAGDLAVRWNCKAGKCGSCSAEINGRPRLLCMTRMTTFEPRRDDHGDAAARLPGDPRPGHRRVVQLREGPRDPGLRAARTWRPASTGWRRSTWSARRSSASASSASCARTPATSCATTRRTRSRSPGRGS